MTKLTAFLFLLALTSGFNPGLIDFATANIAPNPASSMAAPNTTAQNVAGAATGNNNKGMGKGHNHPCQQIKAACESAGFIKGDWKNGDGLWRDCIAPIMQGATNVAGAKKPLPAVDAAVVAACKAKKPKFGEGKVGSP